MERIEIGRDETIFYQFVEGEYKNIKEHLSTRYLSINKEALKEKKPLPQLYKIKEECCGCTACYAVCPCSGNKVEKEKIKTINYKMLTDSELMSINHTGAISMLPDSEGFLYPVVDADICIRCYKCISVCDFK